MERDLISKSFFSDNDRYADIINGIGCEGVPFVKGEDLQEADTRVHLGKNWGLRKNRKRAAVKYRDLLRKTAFGMNFAMVGIENQEELDYALPLRVMCYDAGEYERQAQKIRKETWKNKKGLRGGEYLYGFRKESRLYPTVTFVLYYGEKEWDGAKDIHGLLDLTGLPAGLRENDQSYQEFDEDAYDMVAVYVGAGESMLKWKDKHKKGRKVDMCQGLREWLADERAEGIEEGIAKESGRMDRLIIILTKQNRQDDLVRAAGDAEYKERMYREFGI
ncbi:MAG: hypothetical protein HFI45_10975 [Lachnospiraceae bacterium]|nr:hypothetical protein [Lachnospiraceae bacterium]